MVICHGQTVRRDEKAAGVGGHHLIVDLLLRFVYLHLEPGGEIAVGDLPGGILPVQKAQGIGGGGGAHAAVDQPRQHCGLRSLIGKIQRVIHGFIEVAAVQRAGELPLRDADTPRKGGGIGNFKISGLFRVAQHPQQHGAPRIGVQRAVRRKGHVADAGDPTPAGSVVHSGAGPLRHIPEAREPPVGIRVLFTAGKAHQQHRRLCPGGGGGQVPVRLLRQNMEHRQGIGHAGIIPALGAGHGDRTDKQHHRAQRG